jgi:hypothetical protein
MQIQALDSRRHIRDQADDRVYRFSPAIPRLPGVTAALAYLAPAAERPYNYMYEPPAGTARENCEYRARPVWIKDARSRWRYHPPFTSKGSSFGTRRAR